MHVSAIALGLAGLAAATPIDYASPPVVPHYPTKSFSKGFNLVVNVTDHAHDFKPSVQNLYINSIHVGAGQALVGVGNKAQGRVFYQNGTAEETRFNQGTVISDGATPPAPFGLSLTKDPGSKTVHTAHLNGGPGTKGVSLSRFPEAYSFLGPETYSICKEKLQYYQGKEFFILKRSETTVDSNGYISKNIPPNCVAVRLIPECTKLNDLPKDATASHKYAVDSACYKDVKSIKWSEYGP